MNEMTLPELYRARPRNLVVRGSLTAMLILIVGVWLSGAFLDPQAFTDQRQENIARFLNELRPYPLQSTTFDASVALTWAHSIMQEKGWNALRITIAISFAAITLAGIFGGLLALPAARNITRSEPFVTNRTTRNRITDLIWSTVVGATRLLLIFLRAIPEYVWAFLLLALLGPTAWPAVLALALHNTGIFGKLAAEVIEDLPAGPLRSMTGMGASRLQVAAFTILPLTLPRLLLFFFYRWETCVREATVLGMLGIVSLGFWIQDARARNFYDEMFFLILLGALMVLLGEVISTWARWYVRRAS